MKLSAQTTMMVLGLAFCLSLVAGLVMGGLIEPAGRRSDTSSFAPDVPPNATPIPGSTQVVRLAPTPTPTHTPTQKERIARSVAVSAREAYSTTAQHAQNWQKDATLWEIASLSRVESDGRAYGWSYRFFSQQSGRSVEFRIYEGAASVMTTTLSWAGRSYVVPSMVFSTEVMIDSTQAVTVANSAVAAKYGAEWVKSSDTLVQVRAYKQPGSGVVTWDVSYTDGRRIVVVEVDAVRGTPIRLSSPQ